MDDTTTTESPPTLDSLQQQLNDVLKEKEDLETQHRNLLTKVSTMRNTLGAKLKQDAEELDRQEQLITQLTVERDDLTSTINTLQTELTNTHSELISITTQHDAFRNKLQAQSQETLSSERTIRDLQNQLEECRLDRDEYKRSSETQKALVEEYEGRLEELKREVEVYKERERMMEEERDIEKDKVRNLQSVLQDFQAAKDHELEQSIKSYESQISSLTLSLAEYKSRALNAEVQLTDLQSSSDQLTTLQAELKSKSLQISKLRHEAIIMNEHLIEALRRLRQSSTETKTSVDSRLVTNVLLQFLTARREDTKRFEMLGLLASILNWGEEERSKSGLQRSGSGGIGSNHLSGGGGGFWGGRKSVELEKSDETESFSRLWVEFLLKESSMDPSNNLDPHSNSSQSTSLPGTPTTASPSLPNSLKAPPPVRRLASVGATPTFNLKGKEKAVE